MRALAASNASDRTRSLENFAALPSSLEMITSTIANLVGLVAPLSIDKWKSFYSILVVSYDNKNMDG